MCWRSASESDLSARTSTNPVRTISRPARSLVEVLRDLFRPRRPQAEPADVVPFPAAAKAADRKDPRAA